MDDASILDQARSYVKQLQERVKKLEQDVELKSICSNNSGTSTDIFPAVKARVSKMEVLITIHCEKQNGVMVKILTQLEKLRLSVKSSSVLQFGKSTFGITIVAQVHIIDLRVKLFLKKKINHYNCMYKMMFNMRF